MEKPTKPIAWDPYKNSLLIKERRISFEAIIAAVENDKLIDTYPHPKYANQKIFEVELNGYIVVVPYVEDDEKIFLKTAFQSRKATKKHKKGADSL